jgi:hypothetical protein
MWQNLPKGLNVAKDMKIPIGCLCIIFYLLAEIFLKAAELLVQLAGNL